MEITRHFVTVDNREVHYRRVGSGPPFVLFHVSPQSSAFVIRDLLPLASDYTLIALDTPGYGESEPLIEPAPTMADYADAVARTLTALGVQRSAVYGSHTGANIAVELARRAPGQVAGLVLDGLSLSTPEIAQDRTQHYAPTFTPTAGGEHLAWAWQHTRDQVLFWPWYQPHRANRLHSNMASADYLHDVVLSKMAAADYWLGYRAAFSHDSRDAMGEISVETYFVTADSDAHTQVERSLEGLPANIHFVDTNHAGQLGAIRNVLSLIKADAAVGPPQEPAGRRALSRSYVGPPGGQRLVRRGGPDTGRPLVLLHGGMRTSALLVSATNALAAQRPVLALDIPGNGDSDPWPSPHPNLEAFAEDARAVIQRCGVDEFDLYGESIGATLALVIARQAGSSVGRVIMDRPEFPDADLRAELLDRVAPAIEARWDGSHLLTAWHMLRDGALFWPWYQRTIQGVRDLEPEIEAVALQRRLLAWLKGRLTYPDYIHAGLGVDPAELVAAVAQPTLVIGTRGDILEQHAKRAAAGLPAGRAISNQHLAPPISMINRFLNG
jgi:pimeloyl-ACP methyl ester carboxylesterase